MQSYSIPRSFLLLFGAQQYHDATKWKKGCFWKVSEMKIKNTKCQMHQRNKHTDMANYSKREQALPHNNSKHKLWRYVLPKAFVSVAIPFGAVSIKTIFLIFISIDLRVRLKYTFNTKKTQHLRKIKSKAKII